MTLQQLTSFLAWCTAINGSLFIVWAITCLAAPNWIYTIHRRWYPVSREAHNVAMYTFLGGFKILFIFFNLVPYLALRMMQ